MSPVVNRNTARRTTREMGPLPLFGMYAHSAAARLARTGCHSLYSTLNSLNVRHKKAEPAMKYTKSTFVVSTASPQELTLEDYGEPHKPVMPNCTARGDRTQLAGRDPRRSPRFYAYRPRHAAGDAV